MKSNYKEFAIIAFMVAVLIISQLTLSALNGIEIVTVLLASFVFCCGLRMGIIAVNIFIAIRCVIFGFFPSVVILYILYYNLFVVTFGLISRLHNKRFTQKSFIVAIICSCIMTPMLTVFDNIITPLYFGFSMETAKAYWLMSLSAVIPQEICTFITMFFLFPILVRTFNRMNMTKELI